MGKGVTVFPLLHYKDAEAAIRFLTTAFGMLEGDVTRDTDGKVVHADLLGGAGGVRHWASTSWSSAPRPRAPFSLRGCPRRGERWSSWKPARTSRPRPTYRPT